MDISLSQKWVKKGKVDCEFMTPIIEAIFVILTENSPVVINNTQGPQKYITTGNSCRDTLPCATLH